MTAPREVLIEIGTRWPSSLVLAEAELALHRWREDAARLRTYGWGEKRREKFASLVDRLRARHDAWTTLKGIKLGTAPVEASARKAALVWLERARSILEAAELEDPRATAALDAIPALTESSTDVVLAVRGALSQIRAMREVLDPDAVTDEFFTTGETAAYTLEAAVAGPAAVGEFDSAEHREELDMLDGEIYLTIRGLNRAGVRLFEADGNAARATRYAFQFLVTLGLEGERPPSSRPPPPGAPTPAIIIRNG